MNELFQIGKAYYIQQDKDFFVGIVVNVIDGKWLKMRNTSWVFDIGVVSESLGKMTWSRNTKKVTTEYIGDWIVNTDHVRCAKEWPLGEVPAGNLPK